MKIILCFLSIFFISQLKAQNDFISKDDSTRTFYELKVKSTNIYQNAIIEGRNNFFYDSLSFYSFLDTLVERKDFPNIDFRNFQVGVNFYCWFCRRSCQHDVYDRSSCHRNACSYRWEYYTQRKDLQEEILFQSILVPEKLYCWDSVITKEKWEGWRKDSLFNESIDFTNQILLFRTEGGDCHAIISHEFYLDHVKKKLVWKLFNQYGGCRAGLHAEFLMLVPKPPDGYSISFERILLE